MGFLEEIIKTGSRLLGRTGQGGGMLEQVMGLVNNPETGGLAGLVETFRNKGLGEAVSSWIGTGENKPISGEDITNVLGNEKVQEIASKLGISSSDASSGFAALLPSIIDKLTPSGKLPEEQEEKQRVN